MPHPLPTAPTTLRLADTPHPSPQRGSPAAHQHWTQGVTALRQGRTAQAVSHFRKATELAGQVSLYWLNLASAQRKFGRDADAAQSARRAFELDRTSEPAALLLAELLRRRQRPDEALAVLNAIDAATPKSTQRWLLTGALQMACQDWQAAAMSFLQVLAERPADIESYIQLGFAFVNLRRHGEAAECFRTVSILEPAHLSSAVYAAHHAAWVCDWGQGAEDLQRLHQAFERQAQTPDRTSFSPFCLLSMDDDPAMHRRGAEIEAARMTAELQSMASREGLPAPGDFPKARAALAADGRIRLGFLSADFRTHATSILLVQTLERLPRDRFEVTLYMHGRDDASPLAARIRAAADRFVDCREMTPTEMTTAIRNDAITLLVDLSGYTGETRVGVLALRAAPVQVLWLAYPSTLGGQLADYVIGDPILTPMAHQPHFAEQIAQLPLCYEPTDELREHPEPVDRAACGLPEDAFVFACFNQSYKITEPVFAAWCRILDRVPGSVLWLLVPQEEIQAALRAQAVARGIDASRVIFAPFVELSDHLARLPQADLFLDTFPYGAHTTCSDALWMGLPVLTRTGQSFPARVAASLLNAVGLPEMAVDSAEAYEARAIALATTDRDALTAMRDHLWDNRRDLPLFDNERFTAELAAMFERIAARWQQGLPPAPLAAA